MFNELYNFIQANTKDNNPSVVHLKNDVVVGHNPQGDVICNYVDANEVNRYDEATGEYTDTKKIVFWLLFDFKAYKEFEINCEFTFIEIDEHGHIEIGNRIEHGINPIDNIIQVVLEEFNTCDGTWIEEQKETQMKHRFYNMNNVYGSYKNKNTAQGKSAFSLYKELTWEQKTEQKKLAGIIDYYIYRTPLKHNGNYQASLEMEELGEKAYLDKHPKSAMTEEELNKLFDEIDDLGI